MRNATDRLVLRMWREEDFEPYVRMCADAEVMRYFPSTLNYDDTVAMVQRIQLHFEKHGFGLFALEDISTEKFIGYTGFMIPAFTSFIPITNSILHATTKYGRPRNAHVKLHGTNPRHNIARTVPTWLARSELPTSP